MFQKKGVSDMGGPFRLLAVFTGLVLRAGIGALADAPPQCVQSAAFAVDYAVNDDALPLTRVQLFLSADAGGTWRESGADEDRQSPFDVRVETEGLWGVYLVLTNNAGSSVAPPAPGTKPQKTVFADWTPPIIQLHDARQSVAAGQRVLQIRWTAIDANLPPRPKLCPSHKYPPRPHCTRCSSDAPASARCSSRDDARCYSKCGAPVSSSPSATTPPT